MALMYRFFLFTRLLDVDLAEHLGQLLVELLVAAQLDEVSAVLDLEVGLRVLRGHAYKAAAELHLVQDHAVQLHHVLALRRRRVPQPRDQDRRDAVVDLLPLVLHVVRVLVGTKVLRVALHWETHPLCFYRSLPGIGPPRHYLEPPRVFPVSASIELIQNLVPKFTDSDMYSRIVLTSLADSGI